MLLTASDTAMYEKMDRREKSRVMFGISAAAAFAAILLWGFAVLDAAGIYYTFLGTVTAVVSLLEYRGLKRNIMPVSGCFISLGEGYIEVRQPKGSGRYEACRIDYREVEKVMPGSQRGIPSFFIIIREDAAYSSIQDPDAAGRTVFCIKGEDYDSEMFLQLFVAFCRELPEGTIFAGMENRRRWKMERISAYEVFLYILPALYLLPVFLKLINI